jgi:hypothetical protein
MHPMGFFANHARGIEITGSPGFRGYARRQQLAGLGDWFTDALSTVHGTLMDGLDTLTGAKAQAEAQRNAAAIAQAQAQAEIASSQALSSAIPWVAGAIGLAAVAIVMTRK